MFPPFAAGLMKQPCFSLRSTGIVPMHALQIIDYINVYCK